MDDTYSARSLDKAEFAKKDKESSLSATAPVVAVTPFPGREAAQAPPSLPSTAKKEIPSAQSKTIQENKTSALSVSLR